MRPADKPFETGDGVLFVIVVLSWSLSWFALSLQVGDVAVQTSLMWRFIIAAAVMIGWAYRGGRADAVCQRAPMRCLQPWACSYSA